MLRGKGRGRGKAGGRERGRKGIRGMPGREVWREGNKEGVGQNGKRRNKIMIEG